MGWPGGRFPERDTLAPEIHASLAPKVSAGQW